MIGSAFLLFAGGVNGLILPLRGSAEGFSPISLGLLGTGWAVGYVLGCLQVPGLVQKVGHIRSFSAMCGLAAVSVLASVLLIEASSWIVLRSLAGFCFAGAAMIVESWISEQTDAANRGRVFGIYTMVNLAATTAGQMAITLGDANGFQFFVLAGIFYALALLPTALTSQSAPRPLVSAKLDLRALWKNSPMAVLGVALAGVSNSSFGSLGAVYGERIGLDVTTIALFMSASILAGALAQVPVGYLSDRIDRRAVLVGLAGFAAVIDLALIFIAPRTAWLVLSLIALFGGAIFAMYPVILAHANDHAPPDSFIRTSGGLLLVFGLGSIGGPLGAGLVMGVAGPSGLFMTTLTAHLAIVGYGFWRIAKRAAVRTDLKSAFVAQFNTRMSTPQSAVLNPSAGEAEVMEATTPESQNM